MDLLWHRRDLRPTDNHALAATDGQVLPVFVLDPSILDHASPVRAAYLLDTLSALRSWYRTRESDLLVPVGDPREILGDLVAEYDVDRVVWNRDYSRLARRRDRAIRTTLDDAAIPWRTHPDLLLYAPGSITTNEGSAYAVFSHFWKKWQNRDTPTPHATPAGDDLVAVSGDPIPSLDDLGVEAPTADLPDAGIDAAHSRLETFCDAPIYEYDQTRDQPAADGTSRLSPHLRWGSIGIRTVVAAVTDARDDAPDQAAADSCTEFLRQLAWRDFYTHFLAANPRILTESYRDYARPLEWRNDPAELEAWQRGETGFPIVDAGMRQLKEEAFMHNRLRMIVASFLTKDLRIDWRHGYAWFRDHLVDHDPANEAGGWQWAAGTGADAQPYFRVFNPMTQGKRHDPDATYIREYVPALAEAPTDAIHNWDTLDSETRTDVAPAYPPPLVDHDTRREEAIAMFEAAKDAD